LIRIAFTLIGRRGWMGGLNYQINLLSALLDYQSHRITPVLFLAEDVDPELLVKFKQIKSLEVVQSRVFNANHKLKSYMTSVIIGRDIDALKLFKYYRIDVAFENANYFGWRFPIKCIAWIPDLQHQLLKHYFGFFAFWKREIGFQMQVRSGRHIMLSSDDAKKDFKHFYHVHPNRLHVVKFAVPVKVFNVDFENLITRYKLPKHFFFLPNQFWRHKNHECVIKALALANQKGYSITVAVSGNPKDPRDPDYYPDLLELSEKLGLREQFRMLGLIPYEDVQALMRGSLAMINPSRFEGWSTTVEEAKALGVDMLLSNINVHTEQAGATAEFFGVDDVETLSDLLIKHTVKIPQNKKRKNRYTSKLAEENLKTYSSNFVDMVIKAI
jgi:glycosyltransferase involved in cell wall biosynthesis